VGCFGALQWTVRENSVFSPIAIVHRDSRPLGARKSMSLIFLLVQNLKTIFWSNIGGTTKTEVFAQKPYLLFFRKKISKIRQILRIFDFYFPHMKYGKNWFTCKVFFTANFHVLGLFIPKKSDATYWESFEFPFFIFVFIATHSQTSELCVDCFVEICMGGILRMSNFKILSMKCIKLAQKTLRAQISVF
jgi:hypothetical protein